MGAQLRVYRQRIRSVQATKKITRAMELIAASRIVKAQPAGRGVRAVRARAHARRLGRGDVLERRPPADDRAGARCSRAAVVIITCDRGLAGAYTSSVLKESEQLAELLRRQGKEVVPYLVGRKAVGFYQFRRREIAAEWTGFSDSPDVRARPARSATRLIDDFIAPARRGRRRRDPRRLHPLRQHGDPGARGRPAAAARGRRGRGGARRRTTCCRSTSSSRAPSRCSTRCCRSTSAPASSTRCCRRRPPSSPPASGR